MLEALSVLDARDCLILSTFISETSLLWCFAASAKVRALLRWGDLVEHSGEAIGLLRSVRFRESSEWSFSAGLILTKLGCTGTCAHWLEMLSVVPLLVTYPAVLKSLLDCVLC